MRIWWVVDAAEYWLEPIYTVGKTGRITFEGCRLYDSRGAYKGFWYATSWPGAVRQMVREAVVEYERRQRKAERLNRVRTRSMIDKTK